ncbi:HNH ENDONUCLEASE [Salix purpurea]|uniref:HNH ENDONUCLEASE n=1 Tax=Salix purpurea TaxID=77065 RepID=A0A9Q0VKE2_SALPP|nr:HNH ENDONUCLEASE [Salix purpurea]
MSSSSPQRSMGGNSNSGGGGEDQRPRFFDKMVKKMCWENAEIVPGRHPERWRKDAAGNIVCKRFCNCHGCLCYEYDHILPFSKGGESTVDNCQILQTRVNRFKSNKQELNKTQLKGYSCEINFTGMLFYSPRICPLIFLCLLLPTLFAMEFQSMNDL